MRSGSSGNLPTGSGACVSALVLKVASLCSLNAESMVWPSLMQAAKVRSVHIPGTSVIPLVLKLKVWVVLITDRYRPNATAGLNLDVVNERHGSYRNPITTV